MRGEVFNPEPPDLEEYAPDFEGQDVISEYSSEFCDLVIQYGRDGNKIEGFAGKYNISPDAMSEWLSDVGNNHKPEFDIACKIAVCACYHYWNGLYNHTLKEVMRAKDGYEALSHIYNVVKEIEKSMPNTINPFNKLINQTSDELKNKTAKENIDTVNNLLLGNNETR